MFGVYDKMAKVDNDLYDPKFHMGAINSKEIFDEFLARFTSIIVLLKFNNVNKILNLRCTIIPCLWFKLANRIKYALFIQYIARCRQCDLDIK